MHSRPSHNRLFSSAFHSRISALLLAMVSTMVTIYVAGQLWQDAADKNLPNPIGRRNILDSGFSSFSPNTSKISSGSLQNPNFSSSIFVTGSKPLALSFGNAVSGKNISGCGVLGLPTVKSLYSGCGRFGLICLFGTQAAVKPSTCDGLTVDRIIASEWLILDEDESDWKSHAAAIAQSIHLIKKHLQWKKLLIKLDMLSAEVNKPDL
ncbi:hypothetical protein ACFX2G_024568 [Malus domestica]